MESVSINTTQNVRLDYTVASVGDRILAFLLDSLIRFLYVMLMTYTVSAWLASSYFELGDYYYVLSIATYLPVLLYYLLFETFMNGQTPGKMVLKIKVIKLDGSEPNFGSYLLRWLLRPIDILPGFPFIGIIAISSSRNSQRLGDMLANTTVVKVNREVHLQDTLLKQHDDNYELVFPQVAQLKDEHIALINEVISSFKKEGNYHVVEAMANKMRSLLNIDTGMPPLDFLETLLKDYAHLEEKPYYSVKDRF